jgi:hypothetical protein
LPTSLYCYAWDLAGAAGRARLDRVAELGLDGISLATAYHAGKFLRPGDPEGKVYFPEDGTVYFRPRGRYRALVPQAARVAEEQDVLADLVADGRFAVRGWAVLLHNSRLGFAHPDLVVRNAFGDPLCYSLCPAQPEVQHYAVTLCADLAQHYALAGLALETPGFMPFVHGYHHEFALMPGNGWMHLLLGLCFCDACRQQARIAGIDVEGLRRRVRDAVHGYMAGPATVPEDMAQAWLAGDLALDPELGAFIRWRCQLVTGLVAAIRAALAPRLQLSIVPTVQRPTAAAWGEGSDLAGLAGTGAAIELCLYEPDPGRVLADLADSRRRAGPGADLAAILRPAYPDIGSEAQLLATIRLLLEQGIRRVGFYNMGHIRPHNLAWLGAAAALLAGPSQGATA